MNRSTGLNVLPVLGRSTGPGANPGAAVALAAWQCMLNGLPHAAWVADIASRRVVAVNDLAVRMFGSSAAQLLTQSADSLAASPEDLMWWASVDDPSSPPSPLHSDTVATTGQGRQLHVTRSIRALALQPGAACSHALVTLVDRSAERCADQERETLLAELQATLEATADGILVTDLSGHIRAFNRRFSALWALPMDMLERRDDAAVRDWMRRRLGTDAASQQAYQQRLQALSDATLVSATDRLDLQDGTRLERVTQPLFQAGRVQGRVWSFRDLTEQMAAQVRIDELVRQDALTGLPNRRVLSEHLVEKLALAEKDSARESASDAGQGATPRLALLMVDLDRFGQVNDSLGQAVGDLVLREVAKRIGGCLRQDDLLARLSGDQFAVLLQVTQAEAAEATARRVLRVVAEPYQLGGETFTLTCSVGVALAPAHGHTLDELLRHSESAVRAAKQQGRAGYQLYQARAGGERQAHMALDHAMRQALVSGRFRLHYQPQVCLATGQVVGAEALLRWRDPDLGEVSPGRFIPVAEASGFIVAIGDWVLSQAVRQAALWHQRGHSIPIAINVSALQFQQSHFVDRVASVLAVSGVPAHLLELELTESILVLDADDALRRLQALSQLGLRLSIDDFGTGYSSLSYLKRFPIGKLKIDRSFVSGLPSDNSDASIVQAVLQMARALHLKVVAEGVETEAQRQFLLDAGCDEFQGFLFAPALDPATFEQRLAHSADCGAPGAAPGATQGPAQGAVQALVRSSAGNTRIRLIQPTAAG